MPTENNALSEYITQPRKEAEGNAPETPEQAWNHVFLALERAISQFLDQKGSVDEDELRELVETTLRSEDTSEVCIAYFSPAPKDAKILDSTIVGEAEQEVKIQVAIDNS